MLKYHKIYNSHQIMCKRTNLNDLEQKKEKKDHRHFPCNFWRSSQYLTHYQSEDSHACLMVIWVMSIGWLSYFEHIVQLNSFVDPNLTTYLSKYKCPIKTSNQIGHVYLNGLLVPTSSFLLGHKPHD